MGFSVCYKYYKQGHADQGCINETYYDKDEVFDDVIYVGDPFENVALDVLAGKVLALMARRNVHIFDVQIFELVKKELSFKEQDDGITIKNRKFKFSDGPSVTGKEERTPEEQLRDLLAANPELAKLVSSPAQPQQIIQSQAAPQSAAAAVPNKSGEKPLRMEFYLPDDKVWVEMEQDRLKVPNMNALFTLRNRYPIFEEKKIGETSQGLVYRTRDNGGVMRWVRDKLFNPVVAQLQGEGPPSGLTDSGLLWGSVQNVPVPNLR